MRVMSAVFLLSFAVTTGLTGSAHAKGVGAISGAQIADLSCEVKPNINGSEGDYQIEGRLKFKAAQNPGDLKDATLYLRGSSHQKELAGKKYTTNAGFCEALTNAKSSHAPMTLLYSWSAIGSMPLLIGWVKGHKGTIVEGLGDVAAGEK